MQVGGASRVGGASKPGGRGSCPPPPLCLHGAGCAGLGWAWLCDERAGLAVSGRGRGHSGRVLTPPAPFPRAQRGRGPPQPAPRGAAVLGGPAPAPAHHGRRAGPRRRPRLGERGRGEPHAPAAGRGRGKGGTRGNDTPTLGAGGTPKSVPPPPLELPAGLRVPAAERSQRQPERQPRAGAAAPRHHAGPHWVRPSNGLGGELGGGSAVGCCSAPLLHKWWRCPPLMRLDGKLSRGCPVWFLAG